MIFDQSSSRALGSGVLCPAGSLVDEDIARLVAGYKRNVASRYRALTPDEFEQLPASLWISPKIDGQTWFAVIDGDECGLVAPNGRVVTGSIPVVDELKQFAASRVTQRTVLAGELFAIQKGDRPRCGDVASVLGSESEQEASRLGFHVFDLLIGGDTGEPMPHYADRIACVQRLCEGGKRFQAIKTESGDAARAAELYSEWVEGGKGEGLVVRCQQTGRIYKIKPSFTVDAAVIAFTERADESDAVRSLLLAVMREDGQFQIIGSCGNMGSVDFRKEIFAELSPMAVESAYSYASSSGALFRFVRPKLVVEVKVSDIQSEDSSGKPIARMVLDLQQADGTDRWVPAGMMEGISILHPVLVRVRDDKSVNATDVRASQVLERVFVDDLDISVAKVEKPAAELLRREVYTKTTKGKVGVRKLLVWRTNKEELDADFSGFVVHWTDYSYGRKEPLQRTVRLAPSQELAMNLADELIASNIKSGWKRTDEAS